MPISQQLSDAASHNRQINHQSSINQSINQSIINQSSINQSIINHHSGCHVNVVVDDQSSVFDSCYLLTH